VILADTPTPARDQEERRTSPRSVPTIPTLPGEFKRAEQAVEARPPAARRSSVIETKDVRLAAYALLRGARLERVRGKRGDGAVFHLEAPRVEELEADFHHFGTSGVEEERLEQNVRLLTDPRRRGTS
jgi:hypothetical protein